MIRRLTVIGIGLLIGASFAFWVAGPMMPSGMCFAERVLVWASVPGGPIFGTSVGMAGFHPCIGLGWLAGLLVPAHPFRPNAVTGCVTGIGLFVWFCAGFLAVMVAVWGA
jgi:hypothetical protein